jgi:Flp pilus assembly protein TadD
MSVRAYPKERISYRLLALSVLEQSDRRRRPLEEGLQRYHRLLGQGDHRKSYAHHGACLATMTAGRGDLAFEEARRMVEADPNHPALVALWGDFLRRAGEDDAARAAYERALWRDPDHPRARIGLACLAGIAGDRATMEHLVSEQLRRTPWSPQVQQFARILREERTLPPERIRRFIYIQ